MDKSLNARFAETKGKPIVLEGRTIHITYTREIQTGDRIVVEFLNWTQARAQGVNLRTREGLLEVNDVRSSAISLWVDTAPPLVEVLCIKEPSDRFIMVSNQWRREDGVEDEWTNNAGMLVEESDARVILGCSDGIGPPNFEDLVVELGFEAPGD